MTSQRKQAARPKQLAFSLRTWGGKRAGAGRKPSGGRAGVPHRTRPPLAARFPVHVTLRMQPEVYNLRSRRSYRVLETAFWAGAERFGLRLCGFSVQGNHLHLLVEAADRLALSRGLKGLSVRIAKRMNAMMQRHGRVLADRYHAHILRTPTEVLRAKNYLRNNRRQHRAKWGKPVTEGYLDPYCSESKECKVALPRPQTWLLKAGHSRGGPKTQPELARATDFGGAS